VTNKFAFPMLLDLKPYVAARAAPRAPASSNDGNSSNSTNGGGGGAGRAEAASDSPSPSPLPSHPKKKGGDKEGKDSSSSTGGEGTVPEDRSVSLETAWHNVQRDVLLAKHSNAAVSSDATTAAGVRGAAESSDETVDPLLYDLVGVVLHSGTGHGGHYISLVQYLRAFVFRLFV